VKVNSLSVIITIRVRRSLPLEPPQHRQLATILADHDFETKENQKSCNYLHVDSSLPPLSSFPIIVASSSPTSLSLQPPAAAAAAPPPPYPATATAPCFSVF